MILDERNEFADALALNTGGAATYNVGDQIDLGVAGRNLGVEDSLWLVIQVDTTADSAGGTATATFRLVSDDSATPATNGSATQHIVTAAIPEASLIAGAVVLAQKLPSGNYERYLGIQQTTAGEAFTAGKINAFLTHDISAWKAYPDAAN